MAGRPKSSDIKAWTETTTVVRKIRLPKVLRTSDPWPDSLKGTLTKMPDQPDTWLFVPEGLTLETA